jgi:hypothetical protein
MSPQQRADILLAEHQAARRERALADYYAAERNAGAEPLIANERLHFHAKRLDAEYENDLAILRQCMGRKS